MPDYSNGKIYKIVCNITGEQYIGATIQKLSYRLSNHVRHKNTEKKYKSKDIILRGDYQIVLIENYPCNNKEELEKKEREHIENNICVNKVIPTRTKKEWTYENRDVANERAKLYRKTNIEDVKQYEKQYREKNKDKIKEYYEKNKDEINRKKREKREKNKDELNRKQRELRAKKKLDILQKTI